MRWDRLAAMRVPVLMILAVTVLVGGVTRGAFLIASAAGWITLGVLGCMALAFLAYVIDPEQATDTVRAPDRMMVR